MLRLLFTKQADAVWMSHLDLMRLFQRAFKRAGLPLTHTQGYNPRPSVSIALPLSVGAESVCELLDFALEDPSFSCSEIQERLNAALVDGVQVLACYENGRKLKELSLLRTQVTLEYDSGIPAAACSTLEALFSRDALEVEKRSKNGTTQQNIIPMIRRLHISETDGNTLVLDALICCQEPSLNPAQLVAAITRHCPALKPDFAKCRRVEIYDAKEAIFR